MRTIIVLAICVFLFSYGAFLAKPAFLLATQWERLYAGHIVTELGEPSRQRVIEDQTRLEFVYRRGEIKPLCVDYTLTFDNVQPSKQLTGWAWKFCE